MDLASEKLQNGDGGGGESRGDVGLKAQLPHPQVHVPGGGGESGRERTVIVPAGGVGGHKTGSVGTVDPDGALGNSQLLAAVAGSGGHDSQAKPWICSGSSPW